MDRPLIAIATSRRDADAPATEFPASPLTRSAAYRAAVTAAGGRPVLVSSDDAPEHVRLTLAAAMGLLLSGGGDVDPLVYGAMRHPKTAFIDSARDRMEIEAARNARERGTPILGICRGIQSLNVAFGGALIQDISDEVPGSLQHRFGEDGSALAHVIEIEPGSLLARVMGCERIMVNSRHHQAVERVGERLRANCRAPDGVIEGVESADGLPILAVQCHPENICQAHPIFLRLFEWLVAEAGRRAHRGHDARV